MLLWHLAQFLSHQISGIGVSIIGVNDILIILLLRVYQEFTQTVMNAAIFCFFEWKFSTVLIVISYLQVIFSNPLFIKGWTQSGVSLLPFVIYDFIYSI
jgi:hypothetical protein